MAATHPLLFSFDPLE